jgi:hypothetical protein
MTTLVEFLFPIRNGSHRGRVLATLYYAHNFEGIDHLKVDEIRARLRQARIPSVGSINISSTLAKSGAYVDSPPGSQGGRLWHLTKSGSDYVRDLLTLDSEEPPTVNDTANLGRLLAGLSDSVVKGYVEEAVLCLQVGALRAAVVFLWTAGIRRLHEDAAARFSWLQITAAIQKHDPKSRGVAKPEDFAAVKDKVALLAFRELAMIDKGEWSTLQEGLDLRNRCGHPTNYKPGAAKASAFVEDLVGIVFA